MKRMRSRALRKGILLFLIATLGSLFWALGRSDVVVMALASFGVMALVLYIYDFVMFTNSADRLRDHVIQAFSHVPTPVAISTAGGVIRWQNKSFAETFFCNSKEQDIKKIGYIHPSAAQALYLLIASARQGKSHTQPIPFSEDHIIDVSVHPLGVGRDASLFIWTAQTRPQNAAVKFSSVIEDADIPVIILNDQGEMQRPNKKALELFGEELEVTKSGSDANLFANFFEHASFPAALVSRSGAFLAKNHAFSEIVGASCNSLLNLDLSAQSRAHLTSYFSAKKQPVGGYEIEASNTDKCPIKFTLHPSGHHDHFVVFAQETSTAATPDPETAQSQKMAVVGQLAGGIAHDFNNLLTAIIGFSDLLLVRFRPSDAAFKDVMNIKNNAVRAEKLVRQILAYSSKQTLRPTLVSLTDVIQDFYSNMGQTLGEKVKTKIQHGRDLWFVKADESQLVQVVMNLALNARDAMPNGGELTIRTTNITERDSIAFQDRGLVRGEYVLCEVRDTGTGIEPKYLKKIFDPFFSTKEVGKGTGLGLSTVFGIVKQTGGTILVNSEMGAGTVFQIFLPRHFETEDDLKSLQHKNDAPAQSTDLTGSSTVLLVEDEEAVRSFASRALTTRGYTVLEASTGVEALEVMKREGGRIDLVVSDVVMPEMDGPTLLRHLRQQQPNIKVVFMSGYAEEAFRKNLATDENFLFLPKPFTLKKLAETVKAAAA